MGISKCYYFLYKFSQTLNYLTPQKMRIAYFYGQSEYKESTTWTLCAVRSHS